MKTILQLMLCGIFFTVSCSKSPALSKKMENDMDLSIDMAMSFKIPEQEQHILYHKLTDERYATYYPSKEKNPMCTSYLIETKGLQPGASYSLYSANIFFNKKHCADYIANSEGQLVDKKSAKEPCRIIRNLKGLMNGESESLILVPKDGTECMAATITSNPIEHTWSDGAYTCLWMVTKDARDFMFAGKGFKPKEPLFLIYKRETYDVRINLIADTDGTVLASIQPAVVFRSGGRSILTIKRTQTDEVGTLSYLWGIDALKQSLHPSKHQVRK